jgi:ring-1,2-phenylacetyl-CoA epoxidase subunit PaaD
MVESKATIAEVWKSLGKVMDPQIPVLSIVDLKIVRSVETQGSVVAVHITPTFTGCPALDMIAESIRERLREDGFEHVKVTKDMSARWSTELLDVSARQKLKEFGIAPPGAIGVQIELPVLCPFCDSSNTKLENSFGPTLCRQLYYCNSCRQSFERFKSL